MSTSHVIRLCVAALAVLSMAPVPSSTVGAVPPPSTAYPPDEALDVNVTNPEGTPDYPVEVVITGCVPGERVVVMLGDRTVEGTCDDTTLQVVIVITAPGEPGDYDVVVTFPDRADPTTRRIPITVLSPDQPPPTTDRPGVGTPDRSLPRSGTGGISRTAWAAFVFLVSGVGLVVVTRRRTSGRVAFSPRA